MMLHDICELDADHTNLQGTLFVKYM